MCRYGRVCDAGTVVGGDWCCAWSNMTTRFVVSLCLALAATVAIHRLARRSGVTGSELRESLPGDDVLPEPKVEWTRATTISAPRDKVWPWIVQMGFGRGGWYTSEAFDRIVWRIDNPSSDVILPQWQHPEVGDIIPDGPGFAAYFRVTQIDDGEAIVYRSIRHPYRGHPVDPHDASALKCLEQGLVDGSLYLDFSWVFVLRAIDPGSTRLIVRTRASYERRWLWLTEVPLGLVDLLHVSMMFRGITRRAEGHRGRSPRTSCTARQ
jgi:hypothetical protein